MALLGRVATLIRSTDDAWQWVGSASPKIIAGGQSHRMALVNALRQGLVDLPVAILTNRDKPLETDKAYWARIAEQPPAIPLALVWVGNEINANFLLEQHPPFRVAGSDGEEDLTLLPAEMLKAFVLNKLERLPPVLETLKPRRIVLVGPPPPKTDRVVRANLAHEPFLVAILTKHGVPPDQAPVTPFSFRLRLWKLQREAFEDVAAKHGLEVLPVPPGATDSDGALREDLSGSDASHAGPGYGALVWQALADHLGVTAHG